MRNAFFRIGWREFECLARWHLGAPDKVATAVSGETTVTVSASDVEAIARFLVESELIDMTGPEFRKRYLRGVSALRNKSMSRRFQQNLFLRFPIVDPDRFLHATAPYAALFFARGFWIATLLAGLAGLWLAGRQWETFVGTFPYFFSLSGLATYVLALTFAKTIHEFGHAYAAIRHGLRVPSMGFAFLVFWPVLFTDTTDTWRLRSGRDRFTVAAAGMVAEIALAAWALLLWSLVPPGPVQSALFALATATWLLTIGINVNPLVRFDGYFLLSDALGVENLQPRAFALLRHWFRTACVGLAGTDPEPALQPGLRRFMTVYAALALCYRLFIAFGIGLLLYYFAFKLLGILALAAVIITMIVQPAWKELRSTALEGTSLQRPARLVLTLAVLGGLAALSLVPWQTSVSAPAIRKAEAESRLFSPIAARVVGVAAARGDRVAEGQPLVALESPAVAYRLKDAEMRAERYRLLIDRIQFRPDIADQEAVAREEMARATAEAAGYRHQLASLTLRAPFGGVVSAVSDLVRPGAWVTPDEPVALVLKPGMSTLTAYVGESDLPRIGPGTRGRFYPDGVTGAPLAVEIVSVHPSATTDVRDRSLVSLHGGPIAVRQDSSGSAVPEAGIYETRLRVLGPAPLPAEAGLRETTGVVKLDGAKQSIAMRVWTQIHSILIRESGF